MDARVVVLLVFAWSITGCAVWRVPNVPTIALVAPFEGQFREIGYEALYAVRLAISDNNPQVRLLAVDDGGTTEFASARMTALRNNPAVRGVIALGTHASSRQAQAELGDLPMIIAGYWDSEVATETAVMLASSGLSTDTLSYAEITASNTQDDVIGSAIFGLSVMPALTNTEQLIIFSSGQLPSGTFRERYLASDMFVPEPRHLATLTYDATGILLTAIRDDVPLSAVTYAGLSGDITFRDGYWDAAPVYAYLFDDDGNLVLRDD